MGKKRNQRARGNAFKDTLLDILSSNDVDVNTEASIEPEEVYFYIYSRKKRCFIEELPGETILKGAYRFYEYQEDNKEDNDILFSDVYPMKLNVYDSMDAIVITQDILEKGRFAYHAMSPGFHKICMEPDTDKLWPSDKDSVKFRLIVEVQDKEYGITDDIARKNQLSVFEKELLEMESKVNLLMQELEYAERQEGHFTQQSERINDRIVYWSAFQTIFLVVVCIWQIVHLRAFFRAKKLV